MRLSYIGLKTMYHPDNEEINITILAKNIDNNNTVELGFAKIFIIHEEKLSYLLKHKDAYGYEEIYDALSSVNYQNNIHKKTIKKINSKTSSISCIRCKEEISKNEDEKFNNKCEYCYEDEKDEISRTEYFLTNQKHEIIEINDFPFLNCFGSIAFLLKIKIYEPYRNHGFGRKAIKSIIDFLKTKNVDFLLLKPFPFEAKGLEEFENKRKNLINFYKRFNFEISIGSLGDPKQAHMILSLNKK